MWKLGEFVFSLVLGDKGRVPITLPERLISEPGLLENQSHRRMVTHQTCSKGK